MREILKKSRLCAGMSEEQIEILMKSSLVEELCFGKEELIFQEWDRPDGLYILEEGKALICKDTLAAKRMVIAGIEEPGDMFGEIYAFLNLKQYDIYAIAMKKTKVIKIAAEKLFAKRAEAQEIYEIMLHNMLGIFAGKAYQMNTKLKILGSGSLRQCIVRMLVERQKRDGSIALSMSREEIADYLNVARPSLSRELGQMQDEGLITLDGRKILIADQERMEEYL